MNVIKPACFVPFVVAMMLDSSSAQTAPPCDLDSTEQIGPVTVSGTRTDDFTIDLQPCQTLSLHVLTTGHQTFGAAASVEVLSQEASPRRLFKYDWSSYGTVERTLPQLGGLESPAMLPPYRGTRGVEGLPGEGRITITQLSFTTATYTITVVKSRRPEYNVGGTSFSNAPVISNERKYGSIHPNEPGQFYKVRLEPGQTVWLAGELTGSPTHGALLTVALYDANQQYIKNLVAKEACVGCGTVAFPAGPYESYTNATATGAYYYLKATASNWMVHDFHFEAKGQCPMPVGESVSSLDWAEYAIYIHLFKQSLLPPPETPYASFAGRTVWETAGESDNQCYRELRDLGVEVPWPSGVQLSNSQWDVAADNTFEPDGIGFLLPAEIRWYREHRPLNGLPAECELRIWQKMSINSCDGSAGATYDEHLLRNMIDSTDLGVDKAGLIFWRIIW